MSLTRRSNRIEAVGHRIIGDPRDRTRGPGWEYVHVCIGDAAPGLQRGAARGAEAERGAGSRSHGLAEGCHLYIALT
jgi:hypothetical protein